MPPFSIPFAESIRVRTIEESLAKYFTDSLQAKAVTFDFTRTRFIDLYAQSLLFIWAYRISSSRRSKTLALLPPARHAGQKEEPGDINRFLHQWKVWEGYERLGFSAGPGFAGSTGEKSDPHYTQRYFPFSFYASERDWDSFLHQLENAEDLQRIFPDDTAELAIIGEGGLRGIILGEIGKNAFEHGAGTAAHIVLGGLPGLQNDAAGTVDQKLQRRIRGVPEYAQSFFAQLGSEPCLEMVLSDAGPGIPAKLREAYLADTILKEKKTRPTDADLIEYAFLLHSTSKKDSWYHAIDHPDPKYLTPRGLFFVKNIARRNQALLVCRSGNAYCAWDFLTPGQANRDNVHHGVAKQNAKLGGTQIQLLIPKRRRTGPVAVAFVGATFSAIPPRDPHIVPVGRLLHDVHSTDFRAMARALVAGLHQADHDTPRDALIILDFIGSRWTKDAKDKLHPLISEICHLGLDGRMIALLHTSHIDAVIDELSAPRDTGNVAADARFRTRPFLRLALTGGRLGYVLAGSTNAPFMSSPLAPLLGQEPPPFDQVDNFFTIDAKGQRLPRFQAYELEQFLLNYRTELLRTVMEQPSYGIFHEGRFVLPTGPYVENFYEIGALLESDGRDRLQEALLERLARYPMQQGLLLCLSPVGRELGELLAQSAQCRAAGVTLLPIEESSRFLTAVLPPEATGAITILVDVVVSGTSLRIALNFLATHLTSERLATVRILAVVDRRSGDHAGDRFHVDNRGFPLEALFRKPAVLHLSKPLDWSFAEIQSIDEVKWRPNPGSEKRKPLWNSTEFLGTTCAESDAIRIGHFTKASGPHYKYFFLTNRLADAYEDRIVAEMHTRVASLLVKAKQSAITHIFYPKDSRGASKIARRFADLHGGGRLVPLDREHASSIAATPGAMPSAVLMLDTVSNTNQTAFSLLDAAAHSLKPAIVIGCILIDRSPGFHWRILSNITSYANFDVHVFTLVRAGLPVYASADSCPLCKRRFELEDLMGSRRFGTLQTYFTKAIARLVEQPVGPVADDDRRTPEEARALGQLANYRALLHEAQIQRGRSVALDRLSALLRSYKKERAAVEALFRSCEHEAAFLFAPRSRLPAEILHQLTEAAAEVALHSNDRDAQRAALEVCGAIDSHRFHRLACEFALQHAFTPACIEMLLGELLLLPLADKSITPDKTAAVLAEINNAFEEKPRLVSPATRTLISSAKRGLDYEAKLIEATGREFGHNLDALQQVLTYRGAGATHPFVGQALVMLNMIADVEGARSIIENYYDSNHGFAIRLFDDILPALVAIEDAIELLRQDGLNYLRREPIPSFKSDLYQLDTALFHLEEHLVADTCTTEVIQRVYYSEEILAVRRRLTHWLGKESKALLNTLRTFTCSLGEAVASSCDQWRARFQKNHISLKLTIPVIPSPCYVPRKVILGITDNLLENCCEHAFKTRRPANPEVSVTVTVQELQLCLEVADNGGGRIAPKDPGMARLTEVLRPFNATIESVAAERGVHLRVTLPKKTTPPYEYDGEKPNHPH